MFRIDHPTAAGSLPAPSAAGTPGFFTRGDPTSGVKATVVTADFLNIIQEELIAILAAGGVAPDKASRNQVLTALQALFLGKTANAASASKLATPRLINLIGDVTGGASFDGTGQINITTIVGDDSHAHSIGMIDGLQAALNGKQPNLGFTPYNSTNPSGFITADGRAYPRRSDGAEINFIWEGQGGQPAWLWGGGDGSNMYVYNPSGFSVNYANSAGSADSAGVAGSVNDAGSALSLPGFIRLPGSGALLNFGAVNTGDVPGGAYGYSVNQTFHTAFTNACLGVFVCKMGGATGVVGAARNPTLSGFTLWAEEWYSSTQDTDTTFVWFALGK